MSRNTARSSAFSILALIAYSVKAKLLAAYLLLIRLGHMLIGPWQLRLHPSVREESDTDVPQLITMGRGIEESGALPKVQLSQKQQQIMLRLPHILPGLPPICLN